MARVPASQGPEVQRQALRPVYQGNIDVSSGLQQVSRGLGQAANAMDGAMRREAETEANRIDSEITAGWLQWDAENRRQYQGQNIDEYQAKAEEWWGKARETYGANLSPLVQGAIGPQLARKRNQAMGSVFGHVNTVKERFADQQAEAARQTAIEFGVDTGDLAGARGQIMRINAQQGARQGWTSEMMEVENQRALGTLHLTAITQMAEGDAKGAREYYEANKGEIPASAQARAEQVLDAEVDNQEAKRLAAQNAKLPFSEQIAAGADLDPKLREKYNLEIRNNQAMVKAANAERENEARDQVYQLYEQGKAIPELLLSQMGGPERSAFTNMRLARARQRAEGTDVKTDFGLYLGLRDQIAAGEKVNLAQYAHKIAGSDLVRLSEAQSKMADPKQRESLITDTVRINNSLLTAGYTSKENPEETAALVTEIERRTNAASAANGNKPLQPDEKQEVIDSVLLDKVYVDEFGRDPEKPWALVKKDEQSNAYVRIEPTTDRGRTRSVLLDSVPLTDQARITEALRKAGEPVTKQTIVEWYLKGKARR